MLRASFSERFTHFEKGCRGSSQVNSRSSLSAVPGRARRCSCTIAVGTHAESDRAAHAGTAQTAVSVGDFVQVLLVVGLCVVERASGRNLRGNRIVTGTP